MTKKKQKKQQQLEFLKYEKYEIRKFTTVTRLKVSTKFARKSLMLFTMKYQIELKSEVDVIGMNLVRNLLNF